MLRSEYSANIKLPDSPGPERIFSVYAADADTVADVIGILSKLFDSNSKSAKRIIKAVFCQKEIFEPIKTLNSALASSHEEYLDKSMTMLGKITEFNLLINNKY